MHVNFIIFSKNQGFGNELVRDITISQSLVRRKLAVMLRQLRRDSSACGTGIATGTVWNVVRETGVIITQR